MIASFCLCVFVCSSLHDHIFRTTSGLHKFFCVLPVAMAWSWQRSDTLRTFSIMDDVIFAHKPRLLDIATKLRCSSHAALGLAVNGT